jgi:hypothetical protein
MERRVSAFSFCAHLRQHGFQMADTTTPAKGGRYPFGSAGENGSAVVVAGCDTRDVRAIKANVRQLAIAKLRQFTDVALIIPEGLDHADEREQHGYSPKVSTIQLLEERLIVEMNIERHAAC